MNTNDQPAVAPFGADLTAPSHLNRATAEYDFGQARAASDLAGSMARHPAGRDLPSWADYAADLRMLADTIDALGAKLPLPRYPGQGLTIEVHVPLAVDVLVAGYSLGVDIEESDGHTRTHADIDTVHLRFVHISEESKAEYAARTSYGDNLRVTS